MVKPGSLELERVRCALCGSERSETSATGEDFEYETSDDTFHFVRCLDCDHQYLDPRPATSALDTIYPSDYYSFVGTTNPLVALLQRFWEGGKVRLYGGFVGQGERNLLDVGCGDGRFLSLLERQGDPQWNPVGLEFDEGAVASCRAKGYEAHCERIEDFAQRPDQKNRFDAILMLQLLEHVDDPARVCEHVHTLLKPGGAFIVETPNLGGLDYRLFAGRWWGHYHFPRHWNLFRLASLSQLLASKGFEIDRAEYLISTSSWIISHRNYFKDRGWPRPWWRFFSYQNPLLLGLAVIVDQFRIRSGRETSNMRVIARKRAH
ncbi:MAG: class I SAM-dependent methyltransferase [Myxococcota bacterium]|nr:class I SAM-dependent methyltransferase [Myxococcota bacterium]